MAMQEQWEKLRDAGPRAVDFGGEVWGELRKVHWPTRKETYAATVVVLIVTMIVALFLGMVDLGLWYTVQRALG